MSTIARKYLFNSVLSAHLKLHVYLFLSLTSFFLCMHRVTVLFKKKPSSYKQTTNRCRPSRDKMKCTNFKTAHKSKTHKNCMTKRIIIVCKKYTHKNHTNCMCMCFVAINARGRTSSNTNKQTNNTTKNKHNKTIYKTKWRQLVGKEYVVFKKMLFLTKEKKIFIEESFYRSSISSRRRL